jgi:uncharacterized protein (TIGR02145 family)
MNNSLARLLTLLLLSTGLLSSCDSKSTNPDNKSTDSVASAVIPWNSTVTYGVLVDNRDAQTYRTVQIGTQTWMAQNLNYRNTIDSSDTVGACYNNSVDSCLKYGRLYTWSEVMAGDTSNSAIPRVVQGICPTGWHVPSDTEWTILQNYMDPSDTDLGSEFKSAEGWRPTTFAYNVATLFTISGNGTDTYGFRALPGGYEMTYTTTSGTIRDTSIFAGEIGSWWSSTNSPSYQAFYFEIYNDVNLDNTYTTDKSIWMSLRCVKN